MHVQKLTVLSSTTEWSYSRDLRSMTLSSFTVPPILYKKSQPWTSSPANTSQPDFEHQHRYFSAQVKCVFSTYINLTAVITRLTSHLAAKKRTFNLHCGILLESLFERSMPADHYTSSRSGCIEIARSAIRNIEKEQQNDICEKGMR
jgi:hypothetical protein